MLTGVTRPFHAPHALFTPSAHAPEHCYSLGEDVPGIGAHDSILRP